MTNEKGRLERANRLETRAAKEAAVRTYYQKNDISGQALDIAMKGSKDEIDALELADGLIKDYAVIDALIGGVFAGLVGKPHTQGADVPHPPMNSHVDSQNAITNAFKPKI